MVGLNAWAWHQKHELKLKRAEMLTVIEEMGVPNIKVHSDHWVEFKRIYDADGDGIEDNMQIGRASCRERV